MKQRTIMLIGAALCLMLSLPVMAQAQERTYRILSIGNSFTDDTCHYLPDLLADLGIDNVELVRITIGGCSIEKHYRLSQSSSPEYIFYHSKAGENKWVRAEKKVSMEEILKMGEWDYITLQQQSYQSGKLHSFYPFIDQLTQYISKLQPKAEFAILSTWAYADNTPRKEYAEFGHDQYRMLDSIYYATQNIVERTPKIKHVIPIGSAIQSLRTSSINNIPYELTRDGYHLCYGLGRYTATCTLYETIIAPLTNRSMVGNTLRINNGRIAVTDLTAAMAQIAVRNAVKEFYKTRPIKGANRVIKSYPTEKRTIL